MDTYRGKRAMFAKKALRAQKYANETNRDASWYRHAKHLLIFRCV